MTQYLHFYTLRGRCTSSVAVGSRAVDASLADSLSARIQFQLMALGYSLTLWNETEQAGIASSRGEQFIVRVKSVAVVRDMRAGGATQTLDEIRRGGVEVDPIMGVPEERVQDMLAERLGITRARLVEMTSDAEGQQQLIEMARAMAA